MIAIKRMTAEHVASIAELEKLCFSTPWSANSVASELSNPLSLWLVAEEDGVLLGYIGSQTVMDEADMMNVAVAPSSRRRGLAERLVCALVDELHACGVKSLTLEVRVSNEPALRLYDKLDFHQVGCRPNYYRSPKEDALILRKEW